MPTLRIPSPRIPLMGFISVTTSYPLYAAKLVPELWSGSLYIAERDALRFMYHFERFSRILLCVSGQDGFGTVLLNNWRRFVYWDSGYILGENSIKLVQDFYVEYFSFMIQSCLISLVNKAQSTKQVHSSPNLKNSLNIPCDFTLLSCISSLRPRNLAGYITWLLRLGNPDRGVPAGNHTRKYTKIVTNNTVIWLWSFTSITSSNQLIVTSKLEIWNLSSCRQHKLPCALLWSLRSACHAPKITWEDKFKC